MSNNIPLPTQTPPPSPVTPPTTATNTANAAVTAASGPVSTKSTNKLLACIIGIAFAVICISIVAVSIYFRGASWHLPSFGSNQSDAESRPGVVKWKPLPDGSQSVTLYPGQWSEVLTLEIGKNAHIDQLVDCEAVLNGGTPIPLRKGQDPKVDNVSSVRLGNTLYRDEMVFTVHYGPLTMMNTPPPTRSGLGTSTHPQRGDQWQPSKRPQQRVICRPGFYPAPQRSQPVYSTGVDNHGHQYPLANGRRIGW